MPRVLAGRYALEDELAAGGFARVYRAIDRRLNRPVAVKVLDAGRVASADPGAMKRFVREARSSAGFTHPHAVTVFDAGEADGELFLVMELVDGPSLAQLIADRGQLPEDEAVRIATQVLSALGAAHASGIVHRDVKPANILLDARGDSKLADFGIAKRFDDLTDNLTASGLVIGTLRYLAPEQAKGESVSPASDVYAVGVILHEMLTGAPPFADESLLAAANRDRHPVPRVDHVRADVTLPVADAVARALAPDPADRFDSAEAMIDALRAGAGPTGGPTNGRERAAVAAAGGAPAGVATTIQPLAATQVMPRPAGSTGRSRALILFGILCLVGIAGIALAARDDPSGNDLFAATTDSAAPSEVAQTTPATEPTATTTIVPTTTTVAPTQPPTSTVPTVQVLVPGFPVPVDIEDFLDQLADDPSVIGTHGVDIEHELDRVLRERSDRKQADRAAELIRNLRDWADDESLAVVVADFLIERLAPFAGDGQGDDD
ncbi:MAG TPA: serine/threonine-protein kinase [Ilumatobacteraceae bacterium]|nr:serine/threonine-protein kinase [Ilumatobacteraceae bacterium]